MTEVGTAPARTTPFEARTPVWGTAGDRRAAGTALLGAALVTFAYVVISDRVTGASPTGVEIVGTVTSLACVWVTRRQNVLCMPLGVISVVAMGSYFFGVELVGQGWLHLGYYVPVQVVGWWVCQER